MSDVKVSELIVKYLEHLGAEYVFGIPGAHILPVFDSLYDSNIRTILTKHEQGASFMACGFARQSGKPGICIATAGPGATNLVTGLSSAFVDRLPVLAITGETPTYSFGKGALQESSGEGTSIRQLDVFRGITKYNSIVQRTDYLMNVLRKTSSILLSDAPGPVLLSFPFNVLKEKVDGSIIQALPSLVRESRFAGMSFSSGEVVRLIDNARAPVVIAGAGCVLAAAEEEVSRFCSSTGIPLATTLKARGIIPESSPLSLGVLGITSHETAYRYISEVADLIILAGASYGERTSYNWDSRLTSGKKIIQVDISESQLGKVFTADAAVRCDAGEFFRILNSHVQGGEIRSKDTGVLNHYRADSGNGAEKESEFILISHFLRNLNSHFAGDVSVFDDNIIYMQRFCHIAGSRSYFPNSGISSLGHAVPAAIGAKLATSRPVIALLGDGGFQMCCMELMTAVNYKIPVTAVVINNSSLGLVRKNQHYNYNGRFIASDFINPDFGKLAGAFGIRHFRVSGTADADDVFRTADFRNSINLIEVMLDKNEYPKYSSGR